MLEAREKREEAPCWAVEQPHSAGGQKVCKTYSANAEQEMNETEIPFKIKIHAHCRLSDVAPNSEKFFKGLFT